MEDNISCLMPTNLFSNNSSRTTDWAQKLNLNWDIYIITPVLPGKSRQNNNHDCLDQIKTHENVLSLIQGFPFLEADDRVFIRNNPIPGSFKQI